MLGTHSKVMLRENEE